MAPGRRMPWFVLVVATNGTRLGPSPATTVGCPYRQASNPSSLSLMDGSRLPQEKAPQAQATCTATSTR
eukprot:340397-Pyramimonas_sp.AAC.1